MRSVEEINTDIIAALHVNDVSALYRLADEMRMHTTPLAEVHAHVALGNANNLMDDLEAALEHFRTALALSERSGHRAGAAVATNNIGMVLQRLGDYPAALEHYRRALADLEAAGDRSGMAAATGNIGNIYNSVSDLPSALEHFRRAMELYEELGNRARVAMSIGNIGNIYGSAGDYQLALEHFRQALTIHAEVGDKHGIARVLGNIGLAHGLMGDYEAALDHARRAMVACAELGNHHGMAQAEGAVIDTLMDLDRFEEAADMLDPQRVTQMNDPRLQCMYERLLAKLAMHRGELDAANDHLHTALDIANSTGLRSAAVEYHKLLRDLAQRRNDFAAYIQHNNEYTRINEEIRGKQATQKLAMMEAERKAEAVERERVKERALLYGALPESVANRLLRGEDVSGDHVQQASVLFLDIAGFTAISDRIPPGHVVHLLKEVFGVCDDVCIGAGLTKIKTIGDSYLAIAGVPEPLDDHAHRAAFAALQLLQRLSVLELTMDPTLGDTSWTRDVGEISVRIGLHCGPLVAGVIGTERLQYDVWGDTVNVASRMESTGEPGRIHVSEAFAKHMPDERLTLRGTVDVKGKGPMTTYWLVVADE